MGESVIVSDSLAFNTSRDAHVGTWWFETVIVGPEWARLLQQTALPPAGVQQLSSSVGLLLRVDLHAPSDTRVDVGGRPPQLGRRKRLWTRLARTVRPPVHCSCSHAANTPATTAAAAVAQTRGNTSCPASLSAGLTESVNTRS